VDRRRGSARGGVVVIALVVTCEIASLVVAMAAIWIVANKGDA
jgi:hypothetical protein